MIIFPTPLTWLWVRHQVQICAWDSLIHHKDNWHWEIWGSRCCPLAAVCWGNLSAVWKESANFSFNMYSLSTCKNYGLFKKNIEHYYFIILVNVFSSVILVRCTWCPLNWRNRVLHVHANSLWTLPVFDQHTLNNARVRIVVKYFCLFTAI